VRAVRYHPNRAYGAAIEQVFRCAQRPDLPCETFGRHTIVRTALQDRQAYGCFSFSPATAVKRRARLCGPAYLLAIDKRGPWTVEKQRQDADLCQDTGIKGMHFGPYRAEREQISLVATRLWGSRLYFRRRLGWSRRSEPVRDGSDVLPHVLLRCAVSCGCGSALFQGRSDQQAQLQNPKGRLTNPGTKGGRPSPAPARISLAYSRTNFFLPSPLLG
jgi:hypothetical protein